MDHITNTIIIHMFNSLFVVNDHLINLDILVQQEVPNLSWKIHFVQHLVWFQCQTFVDFIPGKLLEFFWESSDSCTSCR